MRYKIKDIRVIINNEVYRINFSFYNFPKSIRKYIIKDFVNLIEEKYHK